MRDRKEYFKAYYQKHKEDRKEYFKAYQKVYHQKHKEDRKAYDKADVNSNGKPKQYIRTSSNYYLKRYGTKIPGYEIHHCFTYDDPKKFIYCPIKLHNEIHKFLDENGIKADTNHYEQIKHLLDDTVVVYGV